MVSLELHWLPGTLSVCRLDASAPWPTSVPASTSLMAVVRTGDELSFVCPSEATPTAAKVEGPWSAFRVVGTLDFALTGILAMITAPLAEAKISIFAISTFDTDYVLVRSETKVATTQALTHAGHHWKS